MRTAFVAQIGRFVGVAALALILAAALAPAAGAKVIRTNTSIAIRVRNQGDLCGGFGGTLSTETSPTGSVSTTCSGGDFDGQHCINTAKVTDCHMDRVPPPSGIGNSGAGGGLSALAVEAPSAAPGAAPTATTAPDSVATQARPGSGGPARHRHARNRHHPGKR